MMKLNNIEETYLCILLECYMSLMELDVPWFTTQRYFKKNLRSNLVLMGDEKRRHLLQTLLTLETTPNDAGALLFLSNYLGRCMFSTRESEDE